MQPHRMKRRNVATYVLQALVAVTLLVGVAHGKPWAEYAPGPLASDAEYRKLSGRAGWLREKSETAWVEIQWSWREERQQEAAGSGWRHEELDTDERFAALASLPLRKLRKADWEWLAEDAQRRWPLEALDPSPSTFEVASQVGFLALSVGMLWVLYKAMDFH